MAYVGSRNRPVSAAAGPPGLGDAADAADLGVVPASLGRRSAAFAIDAALLLLLSVPAVVAILPIAPRILAGVLPEIGPDLLVPAILLGSSQLLVGIAVLLQLILVGRRGTTLGKRFARVRVVSAATLGPAGFWRSVLRALVLYFASILVPVLGGVVLLMSPAWEREGRGRGWLDRVGRSWAIDLGRGLDPFDATALRRARRELAARRAEPERVAPSLATGSAADLALHPAARSRAGLVGVVDAGIDAEPLPLASPAAAPRPAPQPAPAPTRPASAPVPTSPAATFSVATESAPSTEPVPNVVPTIVLHGDDGVLYPLGERAVVGRNPQSTGLDGDRAVAIRDPASSMSKTHARLRADERGAWIEDLRSSNGTRIVEADRVIDAPAAESRHVPWGSTIEFGDRRFTVEVE